jgi:hypothetical protein
MIKIVIFTMVKNEDDVIREWIEYHGNLFGYNNLYIIDNCSNDNTYEICKEYLSKGIFLKQEDDYQKKGDYTTYYSKNSNCDIFIPLDIDEFIIFLNKDNNTVSKNNIISYLEHLYQLNVGIFKMNYLSPLKTNNDEGLKKFSHCFVSNHFSGEVKDYGKTFIVNKNVDKNFQFDHGNHVPVSNYIYCDLMIIHYHFRSHNQVLKKTYANVSGLGYHLDVEILKKLSEKNACGKHHIDRMITIMENPNCNFDPEFHNNISNDWISLKEIFD